MKTAFPLLLLLLYVLPIPQTVSVSGKISLPKPPNHL